MKITLNKLAGIRSGHTFRGEIKEKLGSKIRMLRIKDIRATDLIDPRKLTNIDWQGKELLPVIHPSEIAIAARGLDNDAALMTTVANVIPSNQLLIISVRSQDLSSEYLCWYLNRTKTQQTLKKMHMGTNIPSLSKKELGFLKIPLPTLKIQKKIIELDKISRKEKNVYRELMNNRDNILEGIYQRLLNGEQQ